jgi:non-ribosomal peptide synthetase component F
MHHIAMDGWSYGSIWIDVMAFYKANVTGSSPQLREVRVQYSDFAAWEQRHLEIGSKKYEAMVSYWKTQLQHATPVLQLPHDYPQRQHQEHRPAVWGSHVVGVEKVEALKSFASSLKVSLYALCISAFRLMLCEFSATDDVIISSTYSLRPPGTENLIGYFLRMLLLRTRLEENDSFSTLVKREMETLTSGIEQSMLPLQDVLKVSNLPRAPGRTPYWQAAITWDEQGKRQTQHVCLLAIYTQHLKLISLSITYAEWMDASVALGEDSPVQMKQYTNFGDEVGHVPTDITLALMPTPEGVHLTLCVDGNLFKQETLDRMFRRLIQIFDNVMTVPDRPLHSIQLLAEEDHNEVAHFSMGDERPAYLARPLAHQAVEAVAVQSPERKCLCYEGEWLSYGEVNARATTLAGQLSSLGVGPGVVVGLMLERSFELVVSILAVFKAGGCYLPCDPSYPDDRLSVYLEDGAALLVLVKTEHAARAKDLVPASVSVVDVETISAGKSSTSSSSLKPPGPEDPAYVIFTSGSTGRPKGVMVPHRGLRDLMPWLMDQFYLSSEDTVIFSNTINFDAHVIQASVHFRLINRFLY